MTEGCTWKIRWGMVAGQCEKPAHIPADDQEHVITVGSTVITWFAGDRREYQGEWPGLCARTHGCLLPDGHHGGCAT